MFVPEDFAVPTALETEAFRLEPLAPAHNERDHAAWMSSIDHIHSTPGYPDGNWPSGRSLDDNRRDLERHESEFAARIGFTYTVLDSADDVIGCVYIYPSADPDHDAEVASWVTADHADLDKPLWRTVSGWLTTDWPFSSVDYASR